MLNAYVHVLDLRMSATGRSYSQNLLKVQYIIIHQAILGGKLMTKFVVADEKVFHVCKAFDRKNDSRTDLRTCHAQLLEKGCQYREEDSRNKKIVIRSVQYHRKSQDS